MVYEPNNKIMMDGFDDEFDEYDEFNYEDAFGDEADELEDEMADAMAYALGAEEADEFFGKLIKGIKRIGGKIFRGVRRVLPGVSRILPGPWGSMLRTGMRVLGRLRYEGEAEEEALDTFAELASHDEAALPVVSALALRKLDKRKITRLPKAKRKALVKKITRATQKLVQKSRNPKSVRAVPIIIGKVKSKAAGRAIPVSAKTEAASKIIRRVSGNRRLINKLARSTPRVVHAKKVLRKALKDGRIPA